MNNQQKALIISKALAYAENNGKPTTIKAGKTGEMKSIYQFTPNTWKQYSKEILGKEVPLTNETELQVATGKVSKWIDKGYTTEQIASMWNAGEGKPNAYKENWRGINKKYGVAYDTPAYAKKVANYASQFEKEGNVPGFDEKPKQSNQATIEGAKQTMKMLNVMAETNKNSSMNNGILPGIAS